MLIAAANAVSYFFRTPSIADLIGPEQNVTEAMGFPFEIWRENQSGLVALYVDYAQVGLNLLVGLGVGAIFGVVGLLLQSHFNRWVAEFEAKNTDLKRLSFQFSVKSLLLVTTVAALLIAALTSWNGTPQVLLAIYFLGPLILILVAMLPRKIHWYHRVAILTVLSLTMIGIAISSGNSLGVPFDRVMLGIFVSWTPQSTFAAFLLVVGLIAGVLWPSRSSTPIAHSD